MGEWPKSPDFVLITAHQVSVLGIPRSNVFLAGALFGRF